MKVPQTKSASSESIHEILQYKQENTMKIKVESEVFESEVLEPGMAINDDLPLTEFGNLSFKEKNDAESEESNTPTDEAKPNIQEERDDDEEIDPDKLVGKGPMVRPKTNSSRVHSEPYPHVLHQPTTIINERQMTGYHVSEPVMFMGHENEIPLPVTEITEHQMTSLIFDNLPPEPELNLNTFTEFVPDLEVPGLESALEDFTSEDIEKLLNISCHGVVDLPNIMTTATTPSNTAVTTYNTTHQCINAAPNLSDAVLNDDPYSPDSAYGSVFGNSPQSSYAAPDNSPRYENLDQGVTNCNDEFLTHQPFYDGRWSSDQSLRTPPVNTVKMNIPLQDEAPMNKKAQGDRNQPKENLPTIKPSGNCETSNRIVTDKSLRDRLISKMRPDRKLAVWYSIICESDEKFFEKNNHGQTLLMLDLLREPRVSGTIEAIYERIGRIKTSHMAEFLCHRDENGHCALYLASIVHSDAPEIAAYIAESYASLGCDVNKPYKNGNTILHVLAQLGDKFDSVMDELLRVTVNGERIFRIDQQNDAGHTPLHLAAMHHMTSYHGSTFSIASILIKHHSSIMIQDSTGATPLHVAAKSKACDPEYFRKLLEQRGAENMQDEDRNTPLHLVALSVNVQNVVKVKKVINHLITSNARMDVLNKEGKRPLDNLHPQCKEVVLKEIQPKRQ